VIRRHSVHESGMIARREEGGRSTVSLTSTKEERFAYGSNFAEPEIIPGRQSTGRQGRNRREWDWGDGHTEVGEEEADGGTQSGRRGWDTYNQTLHFFLVYLILFHVFSLKSFN
jgi:hypothetical protein